MREELKFVVYLHDVVEVDVIKLVSQTFLGNSNDNFGY